MIRKILFTLFLSLPLIPSTAFAADLLERDCNGKTKHGDKIRANFQLFSDSGHITIDTKGYRVDFKKETKKGEKYESEEHGGIEFKVDFKGRYVVGESEKLGKFTLVCHSPRVSDDDDSDGDIDLADLYFSTDSDG